MNEHAITKERENFLKQDFDRGFINFCGFKAELAQWGRFHSLLEIHVKHRQQDGFVHAGVMATMADHTAGYSAFTTVTEDMQILTIEFKINFLRPAYGQRLFCRSQVIREGRKIIVSESDVFDIGDNKKETAVAKAIVTLMAVPRVDLLKKSLNSTQS